ncbi:MAG: SCO family protein [Chitinophagaceae bacterium]|nr:SCO family protein [Anaerolineae bacterium]
MTEVSTTKTLADSSRTNTGTVILAVLLILPLLVLGAFLILRESNEDAEVSSPPITSSVNTIPIDPPLDLLDFTFTASNGESLSLSDLRGKYVLLYFGFTHCPDFCPTTLTIYKRVKSQLGQEAENVAFVFISVDGERDTPDILDEYIGRYDSDFVALQGDETELARIAGDYNLAYDFVPLENGDYTVDHTVYKFLIDPEGRLVRIYEFNESADVIAEDIGNLILN